ncbi:MAG: hypothetical protein EB168_00415 [Euryarchaeota archaeon]|nr:hypothetical protein [Euryarchaeota archaeon]
MKLDPIFELVGGISPEFPTLIPCPCILRLEFQNLIVIPNGLLVITEIPAMEVHLDRRHSPK